MKSGNNWLGIAIMFFVLAVALSLVIWAEVSLAAKIGMFALGFGSGGAFANWNIRRAA